MNGVDEGLDAGGIHVRVDPVPEVGDPSDKSFNIFLAGFLNGSTARPKWGVVYCDQTMIFGVIFA